MSSATNACSSPLVSRVPRTAMVAMVAGMESNQGERKQGSTRTRLNQTNIRRGAATRSVFVMVPMVMAVMAVMAMMPMVMVTRIVAAVSVAVAIVGVAPEEWKGETP